MKSAKPKRASARSAVGSLRLLAALALLSGVARPLVVKAASPAWWSSGVIDSTKPAYDYAAVNQGQLKNIAKRTQQEIDAHLPGGAAGEIHQMIRAWLTAQASNDFLAVNLGQVKNVARPFYDRLISLGYINAYPWSHSSQSNNDFALANIGQVKLLFSFSLQNITADNDSDGNGLPDWWETYYFHTTGTNASALVPGTSTTIAQAFRAGLNPNTGQPGAGSGLPEYGVEDETKYHFSPFAWPSVDEVSPHPPEVDLLGVKLPSGERDYSKVELVWQDSEGNITGFILERRAGDDWTVYKQLSATTRSFVDDGLVGNNRYGYRLSALRGALVSEPSRVMFFRAPVVLAVQGETAFVNDHKVGFRTSDGSCPEKRYLALDIGQRWDEHQPSSETSIPATRQIVLKPHDHSAVDTAETSDAFDDDSLPYLAETWDSKYVTKLRAHSPKSPEDTQKSTFKRNYTQDWFNGSHLYLHDYKTIQRSQEVHIMLLRTIPCTRLVKHTTTGTAARPLLTEAANMFPATTTWKRGLAIPKTGGQRIGIEGTEMLLIAVQVRCGSGTEPRRDGSYKRVAIAFPQ